MLRKVRWVSALLLGGALTTALLLGAVSNAAAQAEPVSTDNQTALRINELMASNGSTSVDPPGWVRGLEDWIEIYNTSSSPVSLLNLAVTDDPARPLRHVITANLTIPANGYLLLFADNEPARGPQHLSFGL